MSRVGWASGVRNVSGREGVAGSAGIGFRRRVQVHSLAKQCHPSLPHPPNSPIPHAVLHVAVPVHDINHALSVRVALVGVVGWAIVQLLTAEAWSKGV